MIDLALEQVDDTAELELLRYEGIELRGYVLPEWEVVLTPEALRFIASLERTFGARRRELLSRRIEVQRRYDAGEVPRFLRETVGIRNSEWTVAKIPNDLRDRRVEITGPVDRKMVINALNSGANVFMADFEDSTSPTWDNLISGQLNLIDAVDGTIEYLAPETGKLYRLADKTATLFVRPRGWHLEERHLLVDERPVSASLFDFGLFFFHNAKRLLQKKTAPYFYLPKMESHREARLWNDVFVYSQRELGIANGTIRATVLIETLPAAFEMDEILWELRDHSAGLNCGRWDFIFSFIKKLRAHSDAVLPDRAQVTMDRDFLRAYSLLLIKTCHRRGIHAMGGMAAQIPIRNDAEANREAMNKVTTDKRREALSGHDGTWVAHPALVPVAKNVFDELMPTANQIERKREDVHITESDLLQVHRGTITERGVRQNINIGVLYLEAWLRAVGCVPLYNLMEDAATAEISRTQLWQWLKHGATLEDGRPFTPELYREFRRQELDALRERVGEPVWAHGWIRIAAELFDRITLAPELADFLTLPAYTELLEIERRTGA